MIVIAIILGSGDGVQIIGGRNEDSTDGMGDLSVGIGRRR